MFRKKRAAYITSAILALAAAALAFAGCKPYNGSQFEIDAKSSFSNAYFTLGEDSHGSNRWREGMVTGNGSQGAVISGSPYDDTIIFQNIHFILPNDNPRVNPDTSAQPEEVRRNIIEGRDITDTQSYDDVYCYHPGGVLRIKSEGGGESGYMRYTDYETAVVGTRYTDDGGQWDRITFTSFADDVTITQISASDKGEKVDVTLSYDDISAMMKFGRGSETDLRYTKRADADGSFLTFAAKYPSYANSELKDGGYATVCYIVAEGGSKRGTEREAPAETQYAGNSEGVVEIKDAENVYVIAASDRTYDMDDIGTDGGLIRSLRDKTRAVAEKYADGDSFGIDAALDAHTAIYSPIFNSVSFSLGGRYDIPNEKLSAANLQNMMSGTLDASLAERAYYSGRYAQICCSGTSTSRLYGMWTGEWASEWGSKYTMDANVNLQVSAMNTGNISTAPVGYANFILRQVADWEDNALATHGYSDAIQAPVNSDGDMALMTESAYPYPFRYWNAGAAWLLYPLYETLQCYGDMRIPVTDEFDLDEPEVGAVARRGRPFGRRYRGDKGARISRSAQRDTLSVAYQVVQLLGTASHSRILHRSRRIHTLFRGQDFAFGRRKLLHSPVVFSREHAVGISVARGGERRYRYSRLRKQRGDARRYSGIDRRGRAAGMAGARRRPAPADIR